MKKLLKRFLTCTLALLVCFSLFNLESVKANTDILNNNHKITPFWVWDNFMGWDKTSVYSTWSYKAEGNNMKFKITKRIPGSVYLEEKIVKLYRYSDKAIALKSNIDLLIGAENTLTAYGALDVGAIIGTLMSGGMFSIGAAYASYQAKKAMDTVKEALDDLLLLTRDL